MSTYRAIFEQIHGKPVALATGKEIWDAGFSQKANRGIRWGWDQDLITHEIIDTPDNSKTRDQIAHQMGSF